MSRGEKELDRLRLLGAECQSGVGAQLDENIACHTVFGAE
jgi:hypothetical protein